MPLTGDPNVVDPDGLYAVLIEAHGDTDDHQSQALNARLVLLLANHIGDAAVLREAIAWRADRWGAPFYREGGGRPMSQPVFRCCSSGVFVAPDGQHAALAGAGHNRTAQDIKGAKP